MRGSAYCRRSNVYSFMHRVCIIVSIESSVIKIRIECRYFASVSLTGNYPTAKKPPARNEKTEGCSKHAIFALLARYMSKVKCPKLKPGLTDDCVWRAGGVTCSGWGHRIIIGIARRMRESELVQL